MQNELDVVLSPKAQEQNEKVPAKMRDYLSAAEPESVSTRTKARGTLFVMYKPEHASGEMGQLFDSKDGHTPENLAQQGWRDRPELAGYNPWNTPDLDEKTLKKQVDDKLREPLTPSAPVYNQQQKLDMLAEQELLRKQNAELRAALDEKEMRLRQNPEYVKDRFASGPDSQEADHPESLPKKAPPAKKAASRPSRAASKPAAK